MHPASLDDAAPEAGDPGGEAAVGGGGALAR
jgi:hypothetical protein